MIPDYKHSCIKLQLSFDDPKCQDAQHLWNGTKYTKCPYCGGKWLLQPPHNFLDNIRCVKCNKCRIDFNFSKRRYSTYSSYDEIPWDVYDDYVRPETTMLASIGYKNLCIGSYLNKLWCRPNNHTSIWLHHPNKFDLQTILNRASLLSAAHCVKQPKLAQDIVINIEQQLINQHNPPI